MSTAIIRGLTRDEAVDAVRDAAVRALGDSAQRGVWTEVGNATVLIGLALRGVYAMVIEVDRAEFDGVTLAELLGVWNGI